MGVVDPRMTAEAISTSFLHCVLKGLHKSPRIVTDRETINNPGILSAKDISCVVIPEGCLGLYSHFDCAKWGPNLINNKMEFFYLEAVENVLR